MNEYKPGKVVDLSLSAEPLAIVGSILLFVLLSSIAIGVLNLPIGEAILGSLLAVILHWVSDIAHHLGHAWIARQTGYPMIGIRLGKWGLLGTSLYPPDEQTLPATIHIRRALGGPTGSLLLSLVGAAAALFLRTQGGALWWVGVFFFLDNLIVFALGALLPLGFTDGSTLLQWMGNR
jgi:Zn-dependent protease